MKGNWFRVVSTLLALWLAPQLAPNTFAACMIEQALRSVVRGSALGNEDKTVWAAISKVSGSYPKTGVPRTFVLSKKIWVHSNATKHIQEKCLRVLNQGKSIDYMNVVQQTLLTSLKNAVEEGVAKYGATFRASVAGWELEIAQRAGDSLPVLVHARYLGK